MSGSGRPRSRCPSFTGDITIQTGEVIDKLVDDEGRKVVQINTGAGCHLDAAMVSRGLAMLDPSADSLVILENVGNLVCPALFDLGEWAKVLVCSVTDGDDKPLKYPHMFRASSLIVLNKIDLLPYVPFDRRRCAKNVRQVNSALPIQEISATRGDGLDAWYDWLLAQVVRRRQPGGVLI